VARARDDPLAGQLKKIRRKGAARTKEDGSGNWQKCNSPGSARRKEKGEMGPSAKCRGGKTASHSASTDLKNCLASPLNKKFAICRKKSKRMTSQEGADGLGKAKSSQ